MLSLTVTLRGATQSTAGRTTSGRGLSGVDGFGPETMKTPAKLAAAVVATMVCIDLPSMSVTICTGPPCRPDSRAGPGLTVPRGRNSLGDGKMPDRVQAASFGTGCGAATPSGRPVAPERAETCIG